jgi:hypothetical protein
MMTTINNSQLGSTQFTVQVQNSKAHSISSIFGQRALKRMAKNHSLFKDYNGSLIAFFVGFDADGIGLAYVNNYDIKKINFMDGDTWISEIGYIILKRKITEANQVLLNFSMPELNARKTYTLSDAWDYIQEFHDKIRWQDYCTAVQCIQSIMCFINQAAFLVEVEDKESKEKLSYSNQITSLKAELHQLKEKAPAITRRPVAITQTQTPADKNLKAKLEKAQQANQRLTEQVETLRKENKQLKFKAGIRN